MRRLFMQSLAIGINENLPNSIKIAKVGSKFAKHFIELYKIAQSF